MEKKSTFIRDILVKVLFIALFLFLLMYLFPMPNLTPFYSAIFNNNIQTMKDAAEDYYTVSRMPSEDGKSVKMTLKEMEDKKLIIPFVDKDGKTCNKKASYVKVTKDGDEYVLKVSLTCSGESNYIVERIGCHDFCNNGVCNNNQPISAVANKDDQPVVCNTDVDGYITVKVPTGKYVKEYEYKRVHKKDEWTLGDWKNSKETESNTVKLNDTRTQYTGQKKVTDKTTLYEQVAYGYNDKWTVGSWKDTKDKETDTYKLYDTRTVYTGQKKVTANTKLYEQIAYGYNDKWTVGDWQPTKDKETDSYKLYDTRTLYTGFKKVTQSITEYKHVKYGYKDNWTVGDWVNNTEKETDTHKLYSKRTLYTGQKLQETKTTKYQHTKTKYTLTKTTTTKKTTCSDWKKDTKWYSSKPASTSSKQYGDSYNSKSTTTWKLIQSSYKSTTVMPATVTQNGTKYKYELVSKVDNYNCTSNCSSNNIVYYYNVYKANVSYQYQYKYKTCTTSNVSSTDTKTVYKKADSDSLVKQGYTLKSKTVEDTKWTTSKTPDSGYEYTGKTDTTTTKKYISLGYWVTNKADLGEYTYNVSTAVQYKYATNNKTKYIIDTKWTKSKTPDSGYEYTGDTRSYTDVRYAELGKWVTSIAALGDYTYDIKTRTEYRYKTLTRTRYVKDTIWTTTDKATSGYVLTGNTKTTSKTTYVDLGKWVTSKSDLGEYTYNIKSKTEYRYKTLTRTKYVKDTKWTTTSKAISGYVLTGNVKSTTKDSYVDLGKWVNNQSDLNEYTYNIKTRTQYRYKYLNTETSTEYKWSENNPGGDWVATGKSRDKYVQTGYKEEKRPVRRNQQK